MILKYILVLAAFIIASVHSEDYEEDAVYRHEHCIKITPEKEDQLRAIIGDIGEFLTNLTLKYEDIDLRYVRVDIESHSDDEREEKEMILKVNINDCHEQGEPANETPNLEEQNKNSEQNGHSDIDVQIHEESNDVENKPEIYNDNKQEQNTFNQEQNTFNQGNVASPNVDNAGSKNQDDQRDVYANTIYGNTDSQSQNQMQNQQETSVGPVNPNQGQSGDDNGCNCQEDATTGPNSLTDYNYDDNVSNMLIKDFDVISAVSMGRPTVTFLQLPENGQEMIRFLESRKKKKIEPVWVYMLEEDNKKEFIVFE